MTIALRAAEAATLGESHRLGMAEMGFAGLSEQWLMRRAGDLHWKLIAGAMGQAEAIFTCSEGRPLYAAFCATRLRLDRPDRPRLAGRLELAARLHRVGRSRLGSIAAVVADGAAIGEVALVSTFVGRVDRGGNLRLVRRAPRAMVVPETTHPALDALARQALRAAAFARRWRPQGQGVTMLPCPHLDFNAAGLLYFPSFAALADRAAFTSGGTRRHAPN